MDKNETQYFQLAYGVTQTIVCVAWQSVRARIYISNSKIYDHNINKSESSMDKQRLRRFCNYIGDWRGMRIGWGGEIEEVERVLQMCLPTKDATQ
jgi:hypothetical protein